MIDGVKATQDNFSAIENCRVPVIAAIHRACIGIGVDMISGEYFYDGR
jgi:enoyl-CoA hydratase/carnithine racemase